MTSFMNTSYNTLSHTISIEVVARFLYKRIPISIELVFRRELYQLNLDYKNLVPISFEFAFRGACTTSDLARNSSSLRWRPLQQSQRPTRINQYLLHSYRVDFTNICAQLFLSNKMRSFFWQMVFGKLRTDLATS